MQKDQSKIEKERYEKRLADLEGRAALAEQKEFYTHMERELMQLVYESFPVNASEELDLCKKRNYSRQQFDDHVADIRRVLKGRTAPVGDVPQLGIHREFTIPNAMDNVDESGLSEDQFENAQRYMRKNGCTWAEAKTKYNKTA